MEKPVQNSFKRYEEKYMLSEEQYESFLRGMQKQMQPDIYGETTNCSIYYDTENWALARRSIAKPVYKEKLRVRSYGVPQTGDPVFIEIKKKYDGVVYKRRITMAEGDAEAYLAGDAALSPGSQISREIDWFQQRYAAEPKVYIAYDRVSWAGIADPELRVTFDRNIRFRDTDLDLRKGDAGELMLPEGNILMEIKIPGTAPLWLAQLLSACRIYPTSFSKYGTFYQNYVLMNKTKESYNYARIHSAVRPDSAVLPDLYSGLGCARPAQRTSVPL